jgi:hypothetical protein
MNGNLTKSEITTLLKGLSHQMGGIYNRQDFEAMMAWATEARLNAELLDLVLMGYLEAAVDEQGIVRFIATLKGLESSRRNELERIES